MRPDVEALLVKRLSRGDGSGSPEYYLAPIDECYKLVGLFAPTGTGFPAARRSGRPWRDFFAQLREKAEFHA